MMASGKFITIKGISLPYLDFGNSAEAASNLRAWANRQRA